MVLKRKWIIAAIALMLVGVLLAGSCSSAGKAKNGDTVQVDYTGKFEDGTVFDSSEGGDPLEFMVGAGDVIQGFDEAVVGMKVGESRTVTIPPEKAYGERSEDMIVTVDRSMLQEGTIPVVGNYLQVSHQDGSTGTVVIVDVSDTTITVDANHPLAGKTLVFDITLVSIAPK